MFRYSPRPVDCFLHEGLDYTNEEDDDLTVRLTFGDERIMKKL